MGQGHWEGALGQSGQCAHTACLCCTFSQLFTHILDVGLLVLVFGENFLNCFIFFNSFTVNHQLHMSRSGGLLGGRSNDAGRGRAHLESSRCLTWALALRHAALPLVWLSGCFPEQCAVSCRLALALPQLKPAACMLL